ncbi:MAG: filamentous hemagglutinin N-terminal domain-containing protein [Potamolinea sp.]
MFIPRASRQLRPCIFQTNSLSTEKVSEVWGEETSAQNQSWQRGDWQIGRALSLGINGAIALTGCFTIAFLDTHVLAQITPDTTLGSQTSVVNNTGNSAIIRGGSRQGINLFHSFSNFNVNTGQTVLFSDPGVTNILGRVTGNNPSNILGTLGVTGGNANLFLLNPNGIIFGPNSKLDVRGSFVATTADAIQFGDSGSFSALVPNVPTATLSVNPSAFLFNQIAAKPITNQSTAGLQVPDGKNLLLLGGNVSLDGGVLRAPGGRIELGGLAASGTVKIEDINSLKLSFPDGVTRADVTLNNNAVVDVVAGDGGDIAINARNINILGGTNVCGGIGSVGSSCKTPGSAVGSASSKAGNIIFAATGDVRISQSRIENNLNEGATGNSGDIFDAVINRNTAFGSIGISGASVSLTDNAQISTTSFGTGSAGIIYLETKGKVSVDNSAVFSSMLAPQQKGNAGGILIEAGSIAVNNSEMRVQSSGIGEAGIVYLKADGGTISLSNSKIFSSLLSEAVGNARGVLIEAGSVYLTDDTAISSSTLGQGNAGEVIVKATGQISLVNSNIFSNVESGAVGNGGSIQIETGSLTLSDGAQMQTLVRGPSDDGTLAGGKGNAGVVFVIAKDSVNLIGKGDAPGFQTAIFSTINEGADGSSGNNQFAGDAFNILLGQGGNPIGSIYILTGNLSLTNGAFMNSSTYGKGNAGAVVVLASDKVSLTNGSAIGSITGQNAQGNAGGVIIGAGAVSLNNASLLTTSTLGKGDAGLILVVADDITVAGKGSGIFSTAESTATGTAGGILVLGTTLFIKDDAEVSVNNQGSGEAGAIAIIVRDLLMLNRGKLTATTRSGQGGDIELEAGDLLVLTRDSGISTTAGLSTRRRRWW